MKNGRLPAAYAGFFSFVFFLILLAPYLAYSGSLEESEIAYSSFSGLCHQIPERSFSIWGYKLGVCSRCTGIYIGLLLGSLFHPLLKPKKTMPPRWLLVASIVPLALDGASQLLGLRESSNMLRLATGLVFGIVIPQYLIPATMPLFDGKKPVFKVGRRLS